jgi:hypothetical protein
MSQCGLGSHVGYGTPINRLALKTCVPSLSPKTRRVQQITRNNYIITIKSKLLDGRNYHHVLNVISHSFKKQKVCLLVKCLFVSLLNDEMDPFNVYFIVIER